MSYVLDTSALLALRDDENGASRVNELLEQAATGNTVLFGCFITLMEIMYRVWKDDGQAAGRRAYAQCQTLPITWVHETPELLESAARLKALYPISLADAWIAATALQCKAILVHKDPEFEAVAGLEQEKLPYR